MKNNIWMSHKFSFSYNVYPNPAVLIKEKSQKEHERSTFNVLLIYMKKKMNLTFTINSHHSSWTVNKFCFSDAFLAVNHSCWGVHVENWEIICGQTRNSKKNDSSQGQDSKPFHSCLQCKVFMFMARCFTSYRVIVKLNQLIRFETYFFILQM